MMNRVDLIGRLTKDLELRRSANGNSNLRFTLAVDRAFKQSGGPEADFISCVAFGKTAENMARYLHKGSLISVEGRIQTGSYMNQQGQRVYTTDVVADRVQFLEPKRASQGYQQDGSYNGQSQSYGGNSYGGGFGDNFGGHSQANPYAQSVDNSFSNFSAPASGSRPAPAASAPANDESNMFNDDESLDISSDDLPF